MKFVNVWSYDWWLAQLYRPTFSEGPLRQLVYFALRKKGMWERGGGKRNTSYALRRQRTTRVLGTPCLVCHYRLVGITKQGCHSIRRSFFTASVVWWQILSSFHTKLLHFSVGITFFLCRMRNIAQFSLYHLAGTHCFRSEAEKSEKLSVVCHWSVVYQTFVWPSAELAKQIFVDKSYCTITHVSHIRG